MCIDNLSEPQKKTLTLVGYGVRGYFDGSFYSEEDPQQRLDMRSANALYRRGLVNWHTRGGAPNITIIDLTEAGWKLFDKIEHS